jgi:hypothetical protein
MEAVGFSETVVTTYRTAWYDNLEECSQIVKTLQCASFRNIPGDELLGVNYEQQNSQNL